MKFPDEKTKHIDCVCTSVEHVVRSFYFEDEPDYVYNTLIVNSFPWWMRIWYAVKYIFGHQSVYGCSQEFLWDKETAKEVVEFLNGFIQKVGKK